MEAKQNKAEQKKLSYEDLQQKFGELYTSYQKAVDYIKKLESAMNEQTFNQTSFFISMLFKVMEHPEMYSTDFVAWATESIESALKAFSQVFGDDSNAEKTENAPAE